MARIRRKDRDSIGDHQCDPRVAKETSAHMVRAFELSPRPMHALLDIWVASPGSAGLVIPLIQYCQE